jgi:hypothetical protein
MSGVYGDLILSFPEQFRTYSYFDQTPNINSGYTPGAETTARGILQNAGSMVKDNNGNLVNQKSLNLWTQTKHQEGTFIRFGDAPIYRIKSGNDWPTEAGYYNYGLEKLVGANGDATIDPGWKQWQ